MDTRANGFHQLGQGKHAAIAFSDVLQRIYTATGTASQRELAAWLGVPQALISDAKRRNRIPIAWLHEIVLRKLDYSPDWILTGQGQQSW